VAAHSHAIHAQRIKNIAMLRSVVAPVDALGRIIGTKQIHPIGRNVWIVRNPGEKRILVIRNNIVRITLIM
jgi:hypothetical protein